MVDSLSVDAFCALLCSLYSWRYLINGCVGIRTMKTPRIYDYYLFPTAQQLKFQLRHNLYYHSDFYMWSKMCILF